jgi:hypothetical protein
MKIKQIYHPYYLWEDYINGMWKKAIKEQEQELITESYLFMRNHKLFGEAMNGVVNNWKYTCEHNLTDSSINHKAFLGQCAVCYQLGAPEYITRIAWSMLSENEKDLANKEAKKNIKLFIQKLKNTKYVSKELFG